MAKVEMDLAELNQMREHIKSLEKEIKDSNETSYDDMHSEQQYLCDLLKEIKSYETI